VRRQFFFFLFFFSSLWAGEAKICLHMTVKDDAKIILRSLESVKKVADCITVCDLGSKDETVSVVEGFLKKSKIPGKVVRFEGKEAVQPCTLSVQEARKVVQALGFSLSDTYLLQMEPGTVLQNPDSLEKRELEADIYSILTHSSLGYASFNIALFRATVLCESVGAVQPFWDFKASYTKARLTGVSLKEEKDEKRNAAEWAKDIELLKLSFEQNPSDARPIFYLALTCRALKKLDEAILWYKLRLEKGGDKEEIWFSKYMLGECYEEKGEWDGALYWYLEAYQYDSARAEPLKKVATYYRSKGENELAYIFAKHGSRVSSGGEKRLFPSFILDPYQFDEELSISAFYTRYKEEGKNAINALLLRKNVPWYVKDQAYRNFVYYADKLQDALFVPIEIDRPLVNEKFDVLYNPMNPAVQKTETGYDVVCRAVNYTQMGAKFFDTLDEQGVFKNLNYLVQYDKSLNLLSQQEIVEDLPRERVYTCNLTGLEDCRIFQFQNRSWFTCTTCDTNPTGYRQISLCRLEENQQGKKLKIDMLTPLFGPDLYRCEKNWLPFVRNGEIQVIYSYDPFIVYRPDIETGICDTVIEYEPSLDFSRFRGSAAPIEFDGGFLVLVHEVVVLHDFQRNYLHRFLFLDQEFKIVKLSDPFIFQHLGVEFCCSMTADHSGTMLLLAVGIEDREALLCMVGFDRVRSLLNPLPVFDKVYRP
jgi:tetratricopeptide (TPR) repeat protein